MEHPRKAGAEAALASKTVAEARLADTTVVRTEVARLRNLAAAEEQGPPGGGSGPERSSRRLALRCTLGRSAVSSWNCSRSCGRAHGQPLLSAVFSWLPQRSSTQRTG